jgi:CubicO group peptidase (beta-lactamase class C family)
MKYLRLVIAFLLFFIGGALKLNSVGSYKMQVPDSYNLPVNQRLDNHLSDFEHSDYIDAQIMRFMARSELMGVSVAIIENEKLVFARSYGYADQEEGTAMVPGHLFRVASVSKLITATAILKLAESGKISLDDKVFGENGFFNDPQYLNIRDTKLNDITVLNLLNHTAGWTQRYGDPAFVPLAIARIVGDAPPANIDTYLKFVTSRKLHFAPGSMFAYSNMGYMFLGAIIEKVTGMKYDDYVRFHILYPNEIYDMHMAKNAFEQRYSNEVTYYEQEGAMQILSANGDSSFVPKPYGGNDIELLGAAGAWVASAPELAKLLTLIDGNDSVSDILSKQSIELMTQGEYAIGWSEANGQRWIRTGNFAGSMAMLYRDDKGIEWVFLTNTRNWQGPAFYDQISALMRRISRKVDRWPDHNLFNYYNTEPLSYYQGLNSLVL